MRNCRRGVWHVGGDVYSCQVSKSKHGIQEDDPV